MCSHILSINPSNVFFFLLFISVEQVKGPEELRERIIQASKQARNQPDYPQELLPDFVPNSVTICDKYLNNYQESHLQSNGE